MNNVFKITLAAALIMSAASTAQAASTGEIKFNGLIISDSCDIKIEQGTNNYTVAFLPTYPADYTGDGDEGTTEDFIMELTGCEPGTLTGVSAAFTGNAMGTDNAILKPDNSSTARNVGIRLYSKHDITAGEVVVKFDGSRPAIGFAQFQDEIGNKKKATLKYTAKVVQVGADAPTPGNYTASATYELVYN